MSKLIFVGNRPENVQSGTSALTVWVGNGRQAPPAAVAHDLSALGLDQGRMDRCHIDPDNEDKMYAAGVSRAGYALFFRSMDGGDTWERVNIASLTPLASFNESVRQLKAQGNGTVHLLTTRQLIVSNDDGATWTDATPSDMDLAGAPLPEYRFMDTCWKGPVGLLSIIPIPGNQNQSNLFRTEDGGATWVMAAFTGAFSLLPSPGTGYHEMIRRFEPLPTGLDELVMLTTHRVFRLSWNSGTSEYDATALWNFALEMAPYSEHLERTGKMGDLVSALPTYYLFDDLFLSGGWMHLGGCFYLTAHSPDGYGWNPRRISDSVALSTSLPAERERMKSSLWVRPDPVEGGFIAGSGSTGLAPVGHFDGLHRFVNIGTTTDIGAVLIPAGFGVNHLWGNTTNDPEPPIDEPVQGCSDPSACNPMEDVEVDDGSCLHTAVLTRCDGLGTPLVTAEPSIVALACRPPQATLNVISLPSAGTEQTAQIRMGEDLIMTVPTTVESGTLEGRIQDYIGQFIAWVHANTSFRAVRIPPALNPIQPGSNHGLWLICPNESCANRPIELTTIGVNILLGARTFDGGSAGATIRLTDRPGCWKVCGTGQCSDATPLQMAGFYDTCTSCTGFETDTICQDCSKSVLVDGVPLVPSHGNIQGNCVAAGRSLLFEIHAAFGSRPEEVIVPVGAPTGCSGVAPIQLAFVGNLLYELPVGGNFRVNNSGAVYTIATSAFNQVTGRTTVTTVENCQDTDPIESVTTNPDCFCRVRVVMDDGADTVEFEREMECANGRVDQQFSTMIPRYGSFRIRIIAEHCGGADVCTYWINSCESYAVVPVGCHQWRIDLIRSAEAPLMGALSTVTVKDLADGKQVLHLPNVQDLEYPLTFSGTTDTLYLVEILSADGAVHQSEVIDLCDLNACTRELTLKLFCGTGETQQAASCAPAVAEDTQRTELDRIALLKSELEAAIYSYRTRWMGIPQYDAERRTSLEHIARLLRAIRETALRCGACTNTSTINTVSLCQTC